MDNMPIKQENTIARTAGEVYEYVRARLASVVLEGRVKVEAAMHKTKAIMEIANAEEYRIANDYRRALAKAIKDNEYVLADTKKKAHMVWKAFTSSESEMVCGGEAEGEVARVGRLMNAYDREQERIRLEKQREAEAKARQEADERALAEAIELEAAGDREAAETVISEPIHIPPVEIAKPTPKLDDSHYRDNWKVAAIDEAKLPREYMMPDMVKINKIVKAMKDKTDIPGIRVLNDRKPVDRGL